MPRKKPVTFDTVLRLGRELPGVEAATSWGAPALKVRGKMFACQAIHKSAEPNTLVVRMDFDKRDELIAADPETYYLKDHYVDYACVLVRLHRVNPDALRDLLRMGWRFVSSGRRIRARALAAMALILLPGMAVAQNRSADEYTRYELLAPESASFKIVYDVTAVSPGARFYFNPIRKGSVASDESVIDLASGKPLEFEQVSGAAAREAGLANADLQGEYIKVTLARAVPSGGGQRIRIIKTYKDPKSYFRDGDAIVFDRPLGIKRNAVVLPPNYDLTACNIPSQILEEPDGRVSISFMNPYPGSAPLVVRARPIAPPGERAPRAAGTALPASSPEPAADFSRAAPMNRMRVDERASQDREIVYFLKEPETHAFSLYHDYTERRPGVDKYVNAVRRGSTVSDPSARNLDTGEALRVETLKGVAITSAAIETGDRVTPDSEVVVVRFPPVRDGESIRLRIEETYTDPARYALVDGQLMWHRSFGRPRNEIVLPAGWRVTTSSIPATVSLTDDGRVRLGYVNPRPDSIEVFVKARRAAK